MLVTWCVSSITLIHVFFYNSICVKSLDYQRFFAKQITKWKCIVQILLSVLYIILKPDIKKNKNGKLIN